LTTLTNTACTERATRGVEVKLVSQRPLWSGKLKDIVAQSSRVPSVTYDRLFVFFVGLEAIHAARAYSDIGSSVLRDGLGRLIEVRVGSLDSHGEFVPVPGSK
jgi:hypothetical protein